MKKFLTLALALLLIVSAVSCAKTNDEIEKKEENNKNDVVENTAVVFENVDLMAIADSLYAEIPEENRPMVMSMPLDSEMFEAFAFIPYEEGIEAVVSEPMISSIAHSVVLVKAKDAENAERIAAAMKENCDPRKWMCVEADIIEGVTNENLAMLLMTKAESGLADKILAAFNALTPENVPVASEEENTETVEDETTREDEESVYVDDENTDATDTVVEPEVNVDDIVTHPGHIAVVPEDVVETPVVNPEENVPAVMPEYNTPAVMPEVNTPAVMPEVNTPAVMPEENVPVEPEVETPKVEAPAGSIDELYALADKLYTGIDPENMPMVGTMELTEENFEYSAFVPYKSTYLAVENMPMMGSQPHSVVIVETSSEDEAKQVSSEMEANANPRKWICVNARSVKSAYKGNRAILVMTSVDVMPSDEIDEEAAEAESVKLSEERAQLIINNFLANA